MNAAFGNWIRLRIVVTFLLAGLVIGAAMAAAAWLLAPDVRIQLAMWAVAALPLGIGLYLSYVDLMFGAGGVQRRLWNVVLDALVWDGSGEALDIGTGQGALAVMLAVRKPAARVIGVDLWAADWEYSKAACERNAVALGVQDRVRFERASAAALPFGDESMDAVVSHFVFHEVKDGVAGVQGALGAFAEAVRVLKPGGALAVQDMFFDARVYGEAGALAAKLRAMGLDEVKLSRLSARTRIPWGLGGRRVLGCAGLVTAVKRRGAV